VNWRPAGREERQIAWLWCFVSASTVLLSPLWRVMARFLSPCVFKALTGLPCPTCGATRSIVYLMDMSVASAFAMNPLVAAGAVFFIAGGVMAPIWLAFGGRVPEFGNRLPRWIPPAAIGLIVTNWTYLLLRKP
jgi:hypothetical protein